MSTCPPRSHCKLLAASSSLPFSTRYDGVSGIKRVPKKSIDGATATSSALCRQFKYVPAMYDNKTPTWPSTFSIADRHPRMPGIEISDMYTYQRNLACTIDRRILKWSSYPLPLEDCFTWATMVITEQQSPPIKLVTYTNSTHGATPVRTQAAANGKDVARRAKRRPLRIIQSPIMAPNHAPSMDSDATHEASCCVTEKADLRDKLGMRLQLWFEVKRHYSPLRTRVIQPPKRAFPIYRVLLPTVGRRQVQT